MERKSFNLTVSELTLSAIIRILADHLEVKEEKPKSWEVSRDGMTFKDESGCLTDILKTLDYVNPPLYGLLLASVHGFKLDASDLEALLSDDDDEEEEGEEHDADA